MIASTPIEPSLSPDQDSPSPTRLEVLRDACVGFVERRRPFPSDRATAEYLAYYEGLYQERGPNPLAFRVMIRRNGRPFLTNPFPEGDPDHYLYHPDGLIMADIEAVLGGLANHWEKLSSKSEETSPDDSSPYQWPSIDEADRARRQDVLETEARWAKLAGVCWAMVLLEPGPLDWLRERVHADNLAWATVQALRTSPLVEWGVNPHEVVAQAISSGVLPARVAKELFPQWLDKVETEHVE